MREPELFTYSQFPPSLLSSADSFILIVFLNPRHARFDSSLLVHCFTMAHGVRSVPLQSLFAVHMLTFPLFYLGDNLPLFELLRISLPIPFTFCIRIPSLQVDFGYSAFVFGQIQYVQCFSCDASPPRVFHIAQHPQRPGVTLSLSLFSLAIPALWVHTLTHGAPLVQVPDTVCGKMC